MPIVIGITIGAAMGLLAGLIGVGGGIIAVPAMIHFLDLDIKTAMGTSLAVIIPLSISGTVKHVTAGHVNYKTAAAIAVGGVVCAYLGAWLNQRMEPNMLRKGFAIFMLCVGTRMLFEKPQQPRKPDTPIPTADQPLKEV